MKRLNLFLLLLALSSPAFAKVFEVRDIRIEGLQRVSAGTVFAAFPISAGDLLDEVGVRRATRSLFRTGYFDDVVLTEDDGVLVVRLKERPAVAEITIEGNKAIKTEDLMSALQDNGLAEGQIFKQDVLEGMTQELQRQYVAQGRYGSSVQTRVEELPRNRVSIFLDVDEGEVSAIKHLNIVGNRDFDEEELLESFELKTTGWLSWFSKDDQYAKEKLSGDLERLESFYRDRGYLRFAIESTQVAVSPNKEAVYITININEGGVYTVSEVDLAGELVVPEEEVRRLIVLREGQTFSQVLMTTTSDYITQRLGNDGYTFAAVQGQPQINDEDKTAKVTFFIDPGKRVYVRRIEFRGNTKTADDVLRREMRQMEGAVASNAKIERGKQRLEATTFVRPDINVQTPEVPGTNDQVDVIYNIEEQPSGSVGATFGFSQTSGFQIGLNYQEDNALGTGKRIGVGVNRSDFQNRLALNYTDPYFTVDGVSAGFGIFARSSDFAELNLTSYETESFGANVNFSYPLSEIERLNYGFGYENLTIDTSETFRDFISPEIIEFIEQNGDSNNIFSLNLGWVRSTLNRGIFATAGSRQSVSVEVAPPLIDDLAYYRLSYSGQRFFPLGSIADFLDGWSLRLRTELGYGQGLGDTERLPFYKNYYAGGFNSVRGFEKNTLGPQTTRVRFNGQLDSNGDRVLEPDPNNLDPFGGNVLVEGSAEVIFPLPFLKDQRSVQASLFFDAGNVFDTECSSFQENCTSPDLGELRYSVGIGATWLSGFGPITFSIAAPLNSGDLDEEEVFQFSLGNTF